MNLKGNFEPASLASILQLLSNEERTGTLHLTNGENEVKIFVLNGGVISAAGSQKQTRLGDLLRKNGMISANDLTYCLTASQQKKQALGSVLVQRGFITEEMLRETIHKQAEEVIFDLFSWKTGYFEYHDSNLVPQGALDTKIDIMNIIMEAMYRIDEMCYFVKQIPTEDLVFRVKPEVMKNEEKNFKPHERRFISLINGAKTVRQLINTSGFDDFSAYHLLHTLLTLEAIEKAEKETVYESQEEGDYSGLIIFYTELLLIIYDNIHTELSEWVDAMFREAGVNREEKEAIGRLLDTAPNRWTYNIVENCKPQMMKQKLSIFAGYHPHNTLAENSEALNQVLRPIKNREKGGVFLRKSFNQFITNLLNTVVATFGPRSTRKMLLEINNILVHGNENPPHFPEKLNAIKEMLDLLIRMAQEGKNQGDPKKNSLGIFALFNQRS
ncbi:protein of unknown function [Desulfatibacillum alkenivorans DSM 16219]|jgi:hypothetical protein|uniref:PatA-like N-terminal domain-containing protein n=1 Tax=Desulfatibacillum alkenivorans DSM 16219 TaxID=1121393 RepID=A0A1M6NKP9_9BACT|nr:DUF4388 domain-containing protein [Desulfatibacillum alkenivorans]SHJ96291.1 protein of unknown function [Desulfatibacillum alkenivorans DSM 16219]